MLAAFVYEDTRNRLLVARRYGYPDIGEVSGS